MKYFITARMAACRLALKMVPGKKSPECTALIAEILNWLEKAKELNRGNDGITSETAAQAIIEEYALNLFDHAEKQDAAEIFNKYTFLQLNKHNQHKIIFQKHSKDILHSWNVV